jgi:hypothetical protein
MHHIDGIDRDQITMFPEALDDYIHEDNPSRFIDTFVGSLDLSSCSKRTKDSEKPDGLRFVRGAQFERFGSGLITPGIRVRTLFKGAWKRKGTLAGV